MKRNFIKFTCFICVALLSMVILGTGVSVFAEGTTVFEMASTWPKQDSTFSATVGCSYSGGSMGVAILEVTYNTTCFEYVTTDKGNQTTDINTDTFGVIKVFFENMDGATSFRQVLNFKVRAGAAVGSKGDISVKITDLTSDLGEDLTYSSTPVSKTLTVSEKPTPTPTPTKPVWTPSPTPTNTPGEGTSEEFTGTPGGTEEIPTDETMLPTQEPTISLLPTKTPVPTMEPTATDDQALLIRSGALGFWLLVVLIVGVWIGIAIGFFIWGRKNGRSVRRSRIIGNDEF